MKSNSMATREEFIRFFRFTTEHGKIKNVCCKLTSKPKDELNEMPIEDVFGDMFDHIDDKLEVEDDNKERWTFRRHLSIVLDNVKKTNSADELKLRDLLRSPWPSILMVIFLPIGGPYFIWAWSIYKGIIKAQANENSDFENALLCGFGNIVVTALFVCSLIFGWAVWIQAIVRIIFALSELVALIMTVISIVDCYRHRKALLSSDEYNYLLPKVENYLKQGKDNDENKEIEIKKEQEENNKYENENNKKPKEAITNIKNNDDIPVETKNL